MQVDFGQNGGPDKQPRRTAFEVSTQLILPALLALAYMVSLMKDQRLLAWVLVGLVVLSLVVSFYPHVASWAKIRARSRSDELIARRAFPELRKFVEQFGEFVSSQRGDTLHYIAQSDLCGGYSDRFNELGIPNMNLFYGFWSSLSERAANLRPTSTDFKATNSELTMLVSSYINYCMVPVFERLPQELRGQLTDRAKSNLEACRERFVVFLNDYSRYLKQFDQPFAARYRLWREFPTPKPL